MFFKSLTPAALALAMTVTGAAMPAQAKDHTARNVLFGVAAAIGAATAIAIATDSHKHHAYANDGSGLGFRDRAVARCVRAAHRSNLRRGGGGVEYLGLRKAKKKSYGLKLYISLRSYENWGPQRRTIKCKVRRNGRIKSFAWLN